MSGRRAPRGTHLFRDSRGVWIWRRQDPRTGERKTRSTQTSDMRVALRIASGFEADFDAGRSTEAKEKRWRAELLPLVADWVRSVNGSERWKRDVEGCVERALADLRLRVAGDLEDLGAIEARLSKLADERGLLTARRRVQEPLRRFSAWLAGNNRHLDRDPLANWEPLATRGAPRRARRSFTPEELAEALDTAGELDVIFCRTHPTAVIYLALLVTGARVGALLAVDVPALDVATSRIHLGPDVGNKRRGFAALDAKTLKALRAYAKDRSGPLFLSPDGARAQPIPITKAWKRTVATALVRLLEPGIEPRDALDVADVLMGGEARRAGGRRLTKDTLADIEERQASAREIAARIREPWASRMAGLDLHALRTTHRTWAEAEQVHPTLIDKQLGHSTASGAGAIEAARALVSSPTGRKHYLDRASPLFEARLSAEAVRRLLDRVRRTVWRTAKSLRP